MHFNQPEWHILNCINGDMVFDQTQRLSRWGHGF